MTAPPKRDFLGKPAPPGYIAGVGRGATGFTTRSDIGPAREAAAAIAASSSSGLDDNQARRAAKKASDEIEEEEYLNESNYDEFAGYGGSLFNKDPYEEDDEEADKIYEAIDKHLDERGKALRESKTRQELELYRQERPKIQQQFSDLKATLKTVSEEEWVNIPDVGDARNRKQRVAQQDKFTPVPDSLLAHQAKLASGGEKLIYIDPKTIDTDMSIDDDKLSLMGQPSGLNIGEMSEFRSSYMSMQLSRISNTVDSQTKANPQDYLTNLQSMAPSQITDAATLKEYRKQFASLRASNPSFANAWIASVRLEEAAGKLKAARALVIEACSKCPKSADIWCEAVRLHPPDLAKGLMVRALKELPRSEKLWIKAADLETDDEAKRRVYANARQLVPKSLMLWKKSVELEKPLLEDTGSIKEEDSQRKKLAAASILREAVECCPESPELWLALARLEYRLGSYENAQRVLIRASEKHPTDRSIWIEAAKLEEANGNVSIVESIINRAVEQLSEKGIQIKREEWFGEAVNADKSKCRATCQAIIKRVIGWNIGDEEKLKVWQQDAQRFVANNSIESARAVFECIINEKNYAKIDSIWLTYASLERQHGSPESLTELLRRSIKTENCIKSETLWLMLANERRNHLIETRQILSDALDANPKSEKIILAAVELECQNGNSKEARRILAEACMLAKTPQLVIRSAELERNLGNLDEAMRMLKDGTESFKNSPELYLMSGQIEEQREDKAAARNCYSNGLKLNPKSVELWISIANIEEKMGSIPKARAKLEMARIRNPKIPSLWLEAARLETRARSRPDIALTLLANGIRECKDHPDVGTLHGEQAALKRR